MTAEIIGQGVLSIKAETDLERYALKKWCEENVDESGNINKIDSCMCIYYGEK